MHQVKVSMSLETGSNQQGNQSGGLFSIGHFANSRKKFVIRRGGGAVTAATAFVWRHILQASSCLVFQLRTFRSVRRTRRLVAGNPWPRSFARPMITGTTADSCTTLCSGNKQRDTFPFMRRGTPYKTSCKICCLFLSAAYHLCDLVVTVPATDPEVRVRFPALPDFLSSSGSGTGSTHPRECNWGINGVICVAGYEMNF
jgi:hypothetical protein